MYINNIQPVQSDGSSTRNGGAASPLYSPVALPSDQFQRSLNFSGNLTPLNPVSRFMHRLRVAIRRKKTADHSGSTYGWLLGIVLGGGALITLSVLSHRKVNGRRVSQAAANTAESSVTSPPADPTVSPVNEKSDSLPLPQEEKPVPAKKPDSPHPPKEKPATALILPQWELLEKDSGVISKLRQAREGKPLGSGGSALVYNLESHGYSNLLLRSETKRVGVNVPIIAEGDVLLPVKYPNAGLVANTQVGWPMAGVVQSTHPATKKGYLTPTELKEVSHTVVVKMPGISIQDCELGHHRKHFLEVQGKQVDVMNEITRLRNELQDASFSEFQKKEKQKRIEELEPTITDISLQLLTFL